MSGDISSIRVGRRQIRLETRFGSARQSRSRKNRPCDVCRNRKTACVIAVEPPCRLCASRGVQCSFTSQPKPKTRSNPQPAQSKPADQSDSPSQSPFGRSAGSSEDFLSQLSPQESRFPVSRPPYRTTEPPNAGHLPLHQLAAAAASQLAAGAQSSRTAPISASDIFNGNHERNRRLSLLLSDDTEYSLEDSKDFTAHFVGLSGEQDTNLFSSIRYNILNETNFVDFNIRQVFPGDALQGTPPIHFSILQDSFSDRDKQIQDIASNSLEAHVDGFGDVLLKLYFRFVHPILPVLSKSRILKSYATNKLSIPASLRGAIYGLASAFLTQEESLKDIPPISQATLFEHSHAALNRELESPNLATLQACLLILHQQPEGNLTTESPKVWALACQATACAQSLGLHQDPSSWRMALWEKKLRKKLWWATYFTDQWTSICHGNTPHITDDSFDTSSLSIEDLSCDEYVVALPGCDLLEKEDQKFHRGHSSQFLELVDLTKLLSSTLRTGFTLRSYSDTIRKVDILGREKALTKVRDEVDSWLSRLPYFLAVGYPISHQTPQWNCPLHLAFFAAKFLTLRALMSPATSTAKSDPTSRLRQHFETAMHAGDQFMDFIAQVGVKDIYAFWPRQGRTNLIISGNFLIYLFFCASTEALVVKAYNMLQKYREYLRVLAKSADWSTIGLVRPSLLRTESFFHGAAEGIRLSGLK